MTCQNQNEDTHNDNLTLLQWKTQHQEDEGTHSNSSTSIFNQHLDNPPRHNKRKPNDQLDQLRQTRKEITRGDSTEDKKGRKPQHAENRQERKRKAEDKLEGAKQKEKHDTKNASTPREEGKQASKESRAGENATADRIQTNSGKSDGQEKGEEQQPPLQKPCRERSKACIRCFNCNARPQKGTEFTFSACPNGHAWLGFRPGQPGCNFCIRHLLKNQASYEAEQTRRKKS